MSKSTATDDSDVFFREYTSQDAIAKYTRATAGYGISYLLDHDYKAVYAEAMGLLPFKARQSGMRVLEFGCGGGMNLLRLVRDLSGKQVQVEKAIGTDFSPVLIDAAKREATNYLSDEERRSVEFYVAKNEALVEGLASATATEQSKWNNSIDFIIGVNTSRYCHRAGKQVDYARDIMRLLVPGGVCVVIDMSDRFLFFRSAIKNKFLRRVDPEDCRIPSLEEYALPFRTVGFEIVRVEHFCWIPHSSGSLMCTILRLISPVLNTVAKSRAMRSLVILKKPVNEN